MAKTDCRPLPPLSEKDIARFWSHVDMRGPDECWPWLLRLGPYGRMSVKGDYWMAHHIALFLHTGEDPFPLLACHTCDNPPCCNGNHLFAGTFKDNLADAAKKGRTALGIRNGAFTHPERVPRGDRHAFRLHPELCARGNSHWTALHPEQIRRGIDRPRPGAKLTMEQVVEIRRLYGEGSISQRALGRIFGVGQDQISLIVNRKNWGYI